MISDKEKSNIKHYWSLNEAVDILARQERIRQDKAWQTESTTERSHPIPGWVGRIVKWLRK